MKCNCNLQLYQCFWPGQCMMDIAIYEMDESAENYKAVLEAQHIYNEMMSGTKENKMTRDEALLKLSERHGPSFCNELINDLEALGLIKFEEEFKILYRMHPLTIRQKGNRIEVLNNEIMVYTVDHK